MSDNPTCLWCYNYVESFGDTCNLSCYSLICSTLSSVTPYLKDGDAPPKDMIDQPWYTNPREES